MACPYKNWSLSRSGDISRGVKFKKNGSGDLERGWKGRGQVTLTSPLSAKISHRQPIYQIWFLYAPVTKLWIAVQMQKMGWFGVVMGTQGHGQFETAHTTSYPTLIETISYHVRDLASYLSKVADFIPPHLYLAPPEGVNPVEFLGDRWAEKTRVLGLSSGVVCVSLHLAVLVQFRLVTDRLIQDHSIISR